jgi:hypothetical protein
MLGDKREAQPSASRQQNQRGKIDLATKSKTCAALILDKFPIAVLFAPPIFISLCNHVAIG